MKYLILVILFISSAYAEKERGGGSLNRLLFHSGAVPSSEPEIKRDYDVYNVFFQLAGRFVQDLTERRLKGQVSYRNFVGQTITLQDKDFDKIQRVYNRLTRQSIRIHPKIESSRGDAIGFINSVKDMSVRVSRVEFNRVMNIGSEELAWGLGSALVGHEILSLAEIENSDQFAVSASMAEDTIWRGRLLACDTIPMMKASWLVLDKLDRTIRHVGTNLIFPIDRINVDLSNNFRTVSFESITTGSKVRLSQFGSSRYLLEYEMGSQLSGAHETFYVMETEKLWCAPVNTPLSEDPT